MEKILNSLVEAGRKGIPIVCADGRIRHVFPIVAAYIADHPEQCLMANVHQNFCHCGIVAPNNRGDPSECLKLHQQGFNPSRFEKEGLHAMYEPFWCNLPHCNIFTCLTPNILHQLHKGVFKDHLVKWCTAVVGKDELDRRFQAIQDVSGLRHFKQGIFHVSQWTGTEHKEMEKVFLSIIAGAMPPRVLAAAQAVIDFIYLAQFQVYTSTTLSALHQALKRFHENKEVFVDLGLRDYSNISKLHSMVHYLEAILDRGMLNGYNIELSEWLHIEYAKEAYRAGNQRDYIAHMTT